MFSLRGEVRNNQAENLFLGASRWRREGTPQEWTWECVVRVLEAKDSP